MSKICHVVTAVGENRTGIVADVSEIIFESGCNIEDSQMSLLGDQFALLTLVSSKSEAAAKALEDGCSRLTAEKGMHAVMFPVGVRWPHCPHSGLDANFLLRVVGQDRSGIVYRTSRILYARSVDILDLTTHIVRAPESGNPIFTLEAHLAVPETADVAGMRRELKSLADEMVIDISLRERSPVNRLT